MTFTPRPIPQCGGLKLDYTDSGSGATRLNVFLTIANWPVERRQVWAWDEVAYIDSVPAGSVTVQVIEATSAANVGSASGSYTVTEGEWADMDLTGEAGTPSDPSSYTRLNVGNCYVRPGEADEYFAGRPETTDWDDASEENREIALIVATRMIDTAYPYLGVKLDGDHQTLQFPRLLENNLVGRSDTRFIPREIREATCEQALYTLGRGVTQDRLQLQFDGVQSFGVGGMSESYRAGSRPGLCYWAEIKLRPWRKRSAKLRGGFDEFPRVEDPTGDAR